MRLALCFDTEPVLGTADGSPREPGLLGLSLYVLHGNWTRRQRIAQEFLSLGTGRPFSGALSVGRL